MDSSPKYDVTIGVYNQPTDRPTNQQPTKYTNKQANKQITHSSLRLICLLNTQFQFILFRKINVSAKIQTCFKNLLKIIIKVSASPIAKIQNRHATINKIVI
jgi:hypothetical protein